MDEKQIQSVVNHLGQQIADLSVQNSVLKAQLQAAIAEKCTCGATSSEVPMDARSDDLDVKAA